MSYNLCVNDPSVSFINHFKVMSLQCSLDRIECFFFRKKYSFQLIRKEKFWSV